MALLIGSLLRLFMWNKALTTKPTVWNWVFRIYLMLTLGFAVMNEDFGFLIIDLVYVSSILIFRKVSYVKA